MLICLKNNFKKLAIGGGAIILFLVIIAYSPSLIGFSSANEEAIISQLMQTHNPQNGISPIQALEAVKETRHDLFLEDAWRSIGFILVSFLLLLLMFILFSIC